MEPLVSVVIPSRYRRELLGRAVASALAQTEESVEVVVVDDGADPPLAVAQPPRVRVIRRDRSGGPAAARNVGLEAARGKWVTFLDDDDRLLPQMVERSLAAIAGSSLPSPVAAISGIDVVGPGDRLVERRIPPSHPRGDHFQLEPLPRGRSHLTKQTLVVEAEVLRAVGGYDESLRLRELTDLFLRLNPACSLQAVPEPGYLLSRDGSPRLSRDGDRLQQGFEQLIAKHRDLLATHPRGHADLLLGQARVALVSGPRRVVLPCVVRAMRLAPGRTMRTLLDPRRTVPALTQPRRTG